MLSIQHLYFLYVSPVEAGLGRGYRDLQRSSAIQRRQRRVPPGPGPRLPSARPQVGSGCLPEQRGRHERDLRERLYRQRGVAEPLQVLVDELCTLAAAQRLRHAPRTVGVLVERAGGHGRTQQRVREPETATDVQLLDEASYEAERKTSRLLYLIGNVTHFLLFAYRQLAIRCRFDKLRKLRPKMNLQ